MAKIVTNEKGLKVVEIDTIVFSGKRKIDWAGGEKYLRQYVGKQYVIDETDDLVFIGLDFPDEYSNSKDSVKAFGTVGKAKANASQAIPESIRIASNISFQENMKEKHKTNAKYGWYRCTVKFTLPVSDDIGNIIGTNAFKRKNDYSM